MTDHLTLDDGADLHMSRVLRPDLAIAAIEEANGFVKHVSSARTICYVISGFTFIFGVYQLSQGIDPWEGGGILVEGLIFAALAYFSPKNPPILISLATALYTLNIVIAAVQDVSSLGSGIGLRAVIVYFLIRGIRNAVSLRKSRTRLRELGLTLEQLRPLDELKPIKMEGFG